MSTMTLRLQAHSPALPVVPSENEQRQHPRQPLVARCWIDDGRHTLYVRIHDLSEGGLSVRAPVPFKAASTVQIELELPSGRVCARAEIVWVRDGAGGSGPRMGARFVDIAEGAEALALALDRR